MNTQSKTYKTYNSWHSMRERCYSAKHPSFKYYGARGIKVCERWKVFKNFMADMGLRPEGKNLGRINNDGHYEPGNCRWETQIEQANNRRGNMRILINGVTKTRAEWCRVFGRSPDCVSERQSRGWDIVRAIITPPRIV